MERQPTNPPAASTPGLSPTEFASAVTAITSAFGDPTRREIYVFAHASEAGVTASVLEALAVEVTDQPGALHTVADLLARSHVNVDNISGFVVQLLNGLAGFGALASATGVGFTGRLRGGFRLR